MKRHSITLRSAAALILSAAVAISLTACSPGASGGDSASTTDSTQTVTFRLWDDVAAPAYEDSFAEFTEQNPSIKVDVEVVPWANYWDRLPLDISSGDMADVYLVNSSNFAQYADNGDLLNVSAELGTDHDEWQQSVVDIYTRDGSLWGVPQLWDSIGLFYNKDMVEKAGVDVNDLTWAPEAGDGDTLLAAAQALTVDSAGNNAASADFDSSNIDVYGFNAQADLQAIYRPFLAQAGAQFQDDDNQFAFASDAGVAAFTYLVDMVNTYHVAPSAADTNTNADITRDMFVQGKLALYQSGPYNLKTIAESASNINWGLAPLVSGPEGRISTVHGVSAVGNAATKNKEATVKVLEWLGSEEGQLPLAEEGVSFPAVVSAQDAFVKYWADRDIDVSVFIDAAEGTTAAPPVGTAVNAGFNAASPLLADLFLGKTDIAKGLAAAQAEGNAAME